MTPNLPPKHCRSAYQSVNRRTSKLLFLPQQNDDSGLVVKMLLRQRTDSASFHLVRNFYRHHHHSVRQRQRQSWISPLVPSYDIHHACSASNHMQKEYTHPAVHLSTFTWIFTMHALTLTEWYSNLDKVPHTSLHLCMDIHQVRVFFLFTPEIPIFHCPKMNTFCPIRGSEIRGSVKKSFQFNYWFSPTRG